MKELVDKVKKEYDKVPPRVRKVVLGICAFGALVVLAGHICV